MPKRTIVVVAAVLALASVSTAGAAAPNPCQLSGSQSAQYVRSTVNVAQVAEQANACFEKGQPALSNAAMDATNNNIALAKAMAKYATAKTSQSTGPLPANSGPVVPESPAQTEAPTAVPASTFCTYPDISSTTRIYIQNTYLMSITKTLHGWCYNQQVVLSTSNWGHAHWTNPAHSSYCAAGVKVAHGPDGSWIGNHSTWAHGAIWAFLGVQGAACYAQQGPWHASLRVAGCCGWWDQVYDYPYSYP